MNLMRNPARRAGLALALVTACAALTGCGSSMGRYNVTVTPAESLARGGSIPSFEVDLVGVAPAELEKWQKKPTGEYFSGRDQLRDDAAKDRKMLSFTSADPAPKKLSKNDPIWQVWSGKGATELFVLVNLPEAKEKLVLPLDRSRWPDENIELEVQRSGLVPRTQMKPAK